MTADRPTGPRAPAARISAIWCSSIPTNWSPAESLGSIDRRVNRRKVSPTLGPAVLGTMGTFTVVLSSSTAEFCRVPRHNASWSRGRRQDGVDEVERGVGGGDAAAEHQCIVDPEVIGPTGHRHFAALQGWVAAVNVGGAEPPRYFVVGQQAGQPEGVDSQGGGCLS